MNIHYRSGSFIMLAFVAGLLLAGMGVPALTGAGHPPALTAAARYLDGLAEYRKGNYGNARATWQRLAESGHGGAQLGLGRLLEAGQGCPPDPAGAARWYRAAADQGLAVARYNLAMLYANGLGVQPDMETARAGLRQAAEQGLAQAQYQLGLMYQRGHGIDRDPVEARRWLERAAGQAHGEAREALATLTESVPEPDVEPHDLARAFTGTGWPMANGLVVTNLHVVAEADSVTLQRVDGGTIAAHVVLRDERHDIAFVRPDDPAALPPALPVATDDAHLGAAVFTIGYPRVDLLGATPKLTDGIISAERGLDADPDSYQISVPIQPGNSGGPLFNRRGEVVGVVTSMFGISDGTASGYRVLPNISYARKAGLIRQLAPLLNAQANPIAELPAADGDLETLAGRVRDSVLLVVAR